MFIAPCLDSSSYRHGILCGNMWYINSTEHMLLLNIPLQIYDDIVYATYV